MSNLAIKIRFELTNDAQASRYAQELREYILDAAPTIHVSLRREDPEAQQALGTEILLPLLTHATIVLAIEGVKSWWELRNRRELGLLIETEDGIKVRLDRSTHNTEEQLKSFVQRLSTDSVTHSMDQEGATDGRTDQHG